MIILSLVLARPNQGEFLDMVRHLYRIFYGECKTVTAGISNPEIQEWVIWFYREVRKVQTNMMKNGEDVRDLFWVKKKENPYILLQIFNSNDVKYDTRVYFEISIYFISCTQVKFLVAKRIKGAGTSKRCCKLGRGKERTLRFRRHSHGLLSVNTSAECLINSVV